MNVFAVLIVSNKSRVFSILRYTLRGYLIDCSKLFSAYITNPTSIKRAELCDFVKIVFKLTYCNTKPIYACLTCKFYFKLKIRKRPTHEAPSDREPHKQYRVYIKKRNKKC